MRRVPIPTVITAAALVLVLVVYMVTYQVRFSEQAIKVRLGKAQDVITEPGLYFKWPPPIERVKTYDMRIRVLDTPESEVNTRDDQALIVGCFAVWKIADPLRFHIRVQDEREADDLLRTRINEVRTTVLGNYNLNQLFSLDSERVAAVFDEVEQRMLAACAEQIAADYGIAVQRIGIRRVALPAEATSTVQESMRSELGRRATRAREGGRGTAEAIKARAESDRDKIMAFAEARAQEIESAGVEASRWLFEKIGREDPDFFVWIMQLEALKDSLAQKTTIFIDRKSVLFEPFINPMLPVNPSAALRAPDARLEAAPQAADEPALAPPAPDAAGAAEQAGDEVSAPQEPNDG